MPERTSGESEDEAPGLTGRSRSREGDSVDREDNGIEIEGAKATRRLPRPGERRAWRPRRHRRIPPARCAEGQVRSHRAACHPRGSSAASCSRPARRRDHRVGRRHAPPAPEFNREPTGQPRRAAPPNLRTQILGGATPGRRHRGGRRVLRPGSNLGRRASPAMRRGRGERARERRPFAAVRAGAARGGRRSRRHVPRSSGAAAYCRQSRLWKSTGRGLAPSAVRFANLDQHLARRRQHARAPRAGARPDRRPPGLRLDREGDPRSRSPRRRVGRGELGLGLLRRALKASRALRRTSGPQIPSNAPSVRA